MAKVITIAHQKGGVGKTTLALNLCACFERAGQRAAVVDADVQGSITDLIRTFSSLDDWRGVPLLDPPVDYTSLQARTDYDLFFIDTPPYLTNQYPAIFAVSDAIIVPCKEGSFDVMAIGDTVALIQQAQAANPHLYAAIAINMHRRGLTFNEKALAILQRYGLPILRTKVHERAIYKSSPIEYGSVFETGNQDAIQEMVALATEIHQELIKHQTVSA